MAGWRHRLCGRPSNRKIPEALKQRGLRQLRQPCYAGFGPTLAAEHLARSGVRVSRETLRGWMSRAGLWRPRRQRSKPVHVWRPRRAAFGELLMMDSSPFRWWEDRGPACHLIALIDDATSRVWGRFAEHDSSEENLRTLGGWLERHGRPQALYTDKNSLFVTSRPVQWQEELRDEPAQTQFGRALAELNIEWIAAHSPQAKGRIERLFGTLQNRLVKEMRIAEIATLEQANRFLEITFWPFWGQRFTVTPAQTSNAHRRLERTHRLEQILSLRVARTVAADHTVKWSGQRWGVAREEVCAGLLGAQAEIERRLDGTHWLRFRGRYLALRPCPAAPPTLASPSGLRRLQGLPMKNHNPMLREVGFEQRCRSGDPLGAAHAGVEQNSRIGARQQAMTKTGSLQDGCGFPAVGSAKHRRETLVPVVPVCPAEMRGRIAPEAQFAGASRHVGSDYVKALGTILTVLDARRLLGDPFGIKKPIAQAECRRGEASECGRNNQGAISLQNVQSFAPSGQGFSHRGGTWLPTRPQWNVSSFSDGTEVHSALAMNRTEPPNKRRYPRIGLPTGMIVAWQSSGKRFVSRVGTLGLGGLFIFTPEPPAVGTVVKLLFELPGGEVRARAVVRDSEPGTGMGVEFTGMDYDDRARLHRLLKRLLR